MGAVTSAGALPGRLRRRVGHGEASRTRPPPPSRRTTPRRRSAPSSCPTGRSTSTRRRRRAGRRPRTPSSATPRTSTRTTSSSPRSASSSRAGQAIDRDLVVLTDWMAGALGRRGLHGEDRQAQRPQREEPAPRAAAPGLRPQPRLHAALAVGHHGHRLQPEEDGPQAHEHQRPLRPEVQGPRVVHLGLARLGQPRPAGHGQEDRHGDQGRPPGGDREARQGQQGRPDPPVHRQRLRQGPRRGEPLGLHRLLRRHRPAAVRQPASSSSSSPRRAPSPGRTT